MELQNQPQPTPVASPPTEPTPPPIIHKGGGFFATLSKALLMLILGVMLLGAGYYFGTQTNKEIAQQPTPTKEVTIASPTPVPPSPTPASQQTKIVKAGLAGTTSFKPYNIAIAQGWTDVRENTETAGIDKLTITKTGYSLTIHQAALGGGGCTYKGEPAAQNAQAFDNSADIKGQSVEYRRGWTLEPAAKTISYTVCQKAEDKTYSSLTTFGKIDVVTPNPADATMLAEIDGMIASMVKQ